MRNSPAFLFSSNFLKKMAKTTFLMTRMSMKNNQHIWCAAIMKFIQSESPKFKFSSAKKIRARSFFVVEIFQFEWNKSGKSWKKSLLILAPFWMAQSDWLFARINQSQAGIQNQFSTDHNFWLPWWILMIFFCSTGNCFSFQIL